MVTQKRQRQRESKQARMVVVQRARKRKEQRKKLLVVVFTAVVLILGVSAFVSTGNTGKEVETSNTTATPARRPVTLTSVPPGETITGDTPCPKADGSSPRTTQFAKPPPPTCTSPSRTYTAEVLTSKGKITIALDNKAAPNTVNNFVVLARYHFYDGIPFHRIIPGFAAQVGDPLATGSGGPGYRFDDELPKPGSYKIGSVAMANSGPNTNGSQFFIVTGETGVNLQPNYSLFGTVTAGMDVVRAIEAVGTPATPNDQRGQPTELVTISSVTIKES